MAGGRHDIELGFEFGLHLIYVLFGLTGLGGLGLR
jgi:hypothetical protein